MDIYTIHIEGGEPLLRRDIYVLLRRLNSIRDLLLVSNGMLIDEDVVYKLKAAGLKKIALSLDGANREAHDKIRGEGSFTRVLNSIELLKRSGFFVRVSYTIMKHNFEDAPRLIGICRDLGVDMLSFDQFDPIGRGALHPEYLLSLQDWRQVMNSLIPRSAEAKDDISIKISMPDYLIDRLPIPVHRPEYTVIGCSSGTSQAAILPNGKVIPCFIHATLPTYHFGDLREDSFEEIWKNSPFLQYYRRLPLAKKCPLGYTGHVFYSNQRG